MDDKIDFNELFSPSEIYHENSKLSRYNIELYKRIYMINTQPELRQIISKPLPKRRGYNIIKLPKQFANATKKFEEIVYSRRSYREFRPYTLPLSTLSKILYIGDGVNNIIETEDGLKWHLRTAPSAGGLYPIEIACVLFNVENVEEGIYFYEPHTHLLIQFTKGDPKYNLVNAMPAFDNIINNCCCCIVLTAIMPRIKFKYGERAYRFVLLEAGHIAQNILLAASAEGLGACPIGGFIDDELNSMLELDGVDEISLYAILIGAI